MPAYYTAMTEVV